MSKKLSLAALTLALAGLTAAPIARSADAPPSGGSTAAEQKKPCSPKKNNESNPCGPAKKKASNPCGPSNPCAPKKRKTEE